MTSTADFSAALASVPAPIVSALEREMRELEERFGRADWGPAELNGGRLAEALLRYMEWKSSTTDQYTPIGTQLNRLAIIRKVENDASLPDGIRFHVRRCTDLLMDVRNKRDVGHLGADIDVNEMDARLLMRLAAWALAEIVREEGGLSAREAQSLIDRFSATHVPLVEEIDGDLVVLATDLDAATRALVALYHTYPDPMPVEKLREAVKYQHASRFRNSLISRLDGLGQVHVKGDRVYLTRKGIAWVEAHVDFELQVEGR